MICGSFFKFQQQVSLILFKLIECENHFYNKPNLEKYKKTLLPGPVRWLSNKEAKLGLSALQIFSLSQYRASENLGTHVLLHFVKSPCLNSVNPFSTLFSADIQHNCPILLCICRTYFRPRLAFRFSIQK